MGPVAGKPAHPHRDLADAAVRGSPVVSWLVRQPMVAVLIALALTAALAAGLDASLRPGSAPLQPAAGVEGGTAESMLPKPTQFPPRARVQTVHRALHAMGRACKQSLATREPASVRRPVEVMAQFAAGIPQRRFRDRR